MNAVIDGAHELARRFRDLSGTTPPYQQLLQGYRDLALQPGSAVLVLATNSVELILHWIAILASGYVPCVIAPSTKPAQIRALQLALNIAAITGPRLEPGTYGACGPERLATIGSLDVIVLGSTTPSYEPFDVLMLTTGTSGSQTACVHRLESLVWNASRTNERIGVASSDKQLVVLPLYHAYGLITQTIGSIAGGCELLIDGPPFSAPRFAEIVQREQITVCGITPTVARELLRRNTVLRSLRSVSIGGDRVTPDEIARLLHSSRIQELYITYGLTEAGPRISVLDAHTSPIKNHDTVGHAFEGIATKIEAPDADGVGQLLVKTPSVCRRRVGDNIARQPFTSDGFLETGDLFTKDADGYLRYIARACDVLVVKGEKLNVRSIDAVAASHPDVEFARTSAGDGNSLVTRVWARDDRVLDLDAIKRFMGQSLRLHEVPDVILQEQTSLFHK